VVPILRQGQLCSTRTLRLQTREEGPDIKNEQYFDLTESQIVYLRNIATLFKDEFPDRTLAVFRVDVAAAYNCHGLTFASRRTCIDSPEEVQRILVQDGYEKVPNRKDLMPGDVIVYRSEGDIPHSGVVIRLDDLNPLVLSKWGANGPEVLHRANYCPYNWETIEYYRVVR
jgi:hypothetical protein